MIEQKRFPILVNPNTRFIFSTSGSASSIERHNRAMERLGLNLVYTTFSFDISPEECAGLLRSPLAGGGVITGKNGLKTRIIPQLDWVEPLAEKTQCVNTVVNRCGRLYGYNTDYIGLKTALGNAIKKTGVCIDTAVVYGYGGVSGVAYRVLEDMGFRASIVGRNPVKLAEKKKELGIKTLPSEKVYDLVVDATPVSSDPNFLEQAEGLQELLKETKMVFCHNMPEKDGKLNYLKQHCEANNMYFVEGKEMYVPQLVRQYSLFFEGLKGPDGKFISENDIRRAWEFE